jgi:predicted nucleotidyltransferase
MGQTGGPNMEGDNLAGILEYLAQTPIVFAVLFGSSARGTAEHSSDVDIGLCFPDEMERHKRFRLRNRIDAGLQQYADGFVDVSDIDTLPTPVAYAALRDGILLVGDEHVVETAQTRLEREYEATAADRKQERQAFVRRLAEGDV